MKKRFLENYFELKGIYEKIIASKQKSLLIRVMFLRHESIYNTYFSTK